MKPNYTDITLILDRSGSMLGIASDTIGGVNRFITDQQVVPGEATWSLVQFDHEYMRQSSGVPIKDAKPVTSETYQPRGNTCLYGAIGCALKETGERLKNLSEDQRPSKVIIAIVTDGEENSSHQHEWSSQHTSESIRNDIERQTSQYKWEIIYIGANQDAILNAKKMGIRASHAINYSDNKIGTDKVYASFTANVSALRCCAVDDLSWSPKQRDEQDHAKST